MKVGKHAEFIIDFVSDFAGAFSNDGRENARLARKFASTVDDTVEYAQADSISDDDFRIMVNNALCDLLGVDEPDLI